MIIDIVRAFVQIKDKSKYITSVLLTLLLIGIMSGGAEATTNASQDFNFAHITDVHLGYFRSPLGYPEDMKSSLLNFTDIQQAVKRDNPGLILITGDLVETDNRDFFIAFKNLLRSIDIPVKTTPGNHDRYYIHQLYGNNLSDYNAYIKPLSNPSSSDNNYYFDFNGYRFIGLDSGADYSALFDEANVTDISVKECTESTCDFSPESDGLSNKQMASLRGEFNSSSPKIIFMHAPVMNFVDDSSPDGKIVPNDGGPGGNDMTIAFNRWNFINYSKDSNVQLVLSGHNHQDAIFNISGNPTTNNSPAPLFIQTRSVTKLYGDLKPGYRIIEVKDGKVNPHNSTSTPKYNRITGAVYLNYTDNLSLNRMGLHAYDSQGRHTGMNQDCSDNANDNISIGIPDSYYTGDYGRKTITPQFIVGYQDDTNNKTINEFKLFSSGCQADAQPTGLSYNMIIEDQAETSTVTVDFHNINVMSNSISTVNIRDIVKNYSLEIDMDGNGTIDKIIYPDSISTIPMNSQSNIGIIAYNGTGIINLTSSSGNFTKAASVNASSILGKPDYEFPYGLMDFEISGLNHNQTVNITITLPQALPRSAQYWKYGRTIDNTTSHWYQILIGSNDGDNIITIQLQDGGMWDDDLTANGEIVHAGGPGITITDYSRPEHWLSLPSSVNKTVDVFYLYGSAWQKIDINESNICKIDNPSMLNGSKGDFARKATAFETVGNIYAPYYRQADGKYALTLPLEEKDKLVGGIPKSDVFAAFDYYIENYNNGSHFILAGHSQGSNELAYLLSDYMKENPEVYKRMIAAYVIGYSITEDYLAENPHLKFAQGPDDTGVIISYNTEAPEVEGNNPVLLPDAISINPITWTRTEKLATAEESSGSILLNPNGSVVLDNDGKIAQFENFADARVNISRGVVICSTVNVTKFSPGNSILPKGVFHSFDYPFYYYNIRENADNRIKNFSRSSPAQKPTDAVTDAGLKADSTLSPRVSPLQKTPTTGVLAGIFVVFLSWIILRRKS